MSESLYEQFCSILLEKKAMDEKLRKVAEAAYQLAELDISSKSAWNDFYQAVDEGKSEEELRDILEDAEQASKDVNEFWRKLQLSGLSDYMPEQY
jgi:hypothetical protein